MFMGLNMVCYFKKVFLKIRYFFTRWRFYIGRDPRHVPQESLIIFPLMPNVLCCGFAGILTIKRPSNLRSEDMIDELERLSGEIRKKGIKAVLAGSIASNLYLFGYQPLEQMEEAVLQLKTDRHFEYLFHDTKKRQKLTCLAEEIREFLSQEEKSLEVKAGLLSTGDLEIINSRLILLRDVLWALEKDILDNIDKIVALADAKKVNDIAPVALRKYKKINFLLNCLDRLEVRGRDSAGIQIFFTFSDPDSQKLEALFAELKEKGLYDDFQERSRHKDFVNSSISFCSDGKLKGDQNGEQRLSFIYKTSSVIGELGRNVRELRKAITGDQIFHEFAKLDVASDVFFAHTRWASVGSITVENCHPINNFVICDKASSEGRHYPHYGKGNWTISVVLNGDIDNYQALREALESGQNRIAAEVTTDTKVIPMQIEKYLLAGYDLAESFRLAVSDFDGSHAIAMISDVEPGKAFLALRGSGQSIYVGIAPDQYIFSSELYGLVEGTTFFLKLDGEKLSTSGNPDSSGQIFILDQHSHGGVTGIKALHYDGMPVDVQPTDIKKAEITTRDIDRGLYPHFFMKEISESTLSVKKTLQGKYRISAGKKEKKKVVFNLGPDVIPDSLRKALVRGKIREIIVIGHGTAAVAGVAVADALARYLADTPMKIEAKVASEMSGFSLKNDLKETLVIPITQSGTTTDTNRAVAMATERGAPVVAIVNRRQSDITSKAHGVFYTSDGRDIEMSVASTKAFYSQIVAGHILGLFFAQLLKAVSDEFIADELSNLERAPALMAMVLAKKEQIRESVYNTAKQKKYWAVVGSGPNKAAADEIRIKLSELCYKTISSDIVENKKHIDLSAEPLIIVCAAGSSETVVGDIVKDAAIFKAHKAAVVVFADEGEERFDGIADSVIHLPRASLPLPVILNTLAGHLWGYYAAYSIDEDALFFREFRSQLSTAMIEQRKKNYSLYESIADRHFRRMMGEFNAKFQQLMQKGFFTFANVKTISDMILLLKYAGGKLPIDDFWSEFKIEDGAVSPVDLLDTTLGLAVDELSRPIDAIRHQAKTVTVGTSRKELPLEGIIFHLLKELNLSIRLLTSRNIMTIRNIQRAISAINGYMLYAINNLDQDGTPQDTSTIAITKRGGVAQKMRSRVEGSNMLMGVKRTIASTGHVYLGRGKTDGAPIMIVPLRGSAAGISRLLLIHISFNEALNLSEKMEVLGYRYNDIRNLINEYNLTWNDRYLEAVSLESLFSEPIEVIAGQIKSQFGQQ
jgi:glucosamine--fructose-6-phosphate aminotransferase (isomerizing)